MASSQLSSSSSSSMVSTARAIVVGAVVSLTGFTIARKWTRLRRRSTFDAAAAATDSDGDDGDDLPTATGRRPHSPSLHRETMDEVGLALQHAVGVDIGGTLAKIVYFVPRTEVPTSPEEHAANGRAKEYILTSQDYGTTGHRDVEQEFFSPALNGTLHFIKFETRRFESALQIIKQKGLVHAGTHVYGTGGGAVKFQKTFRETLGVGVHKFDELETLVNGMGFLMYHYPTECYTLRNFRFGQADNMEQVFRKTGPVYPYLLVNIGTGVSMLLVEREGVFRRVGGTALGGGTFFGLVSLLTGCDSFQEAISLALQGNHMNVDLLVRDIYGGGYDKFGLRGTVIASSFGKMMRPGNRTNVQSSDLALATLQMISMNIGMLAHLHAEANGAKSTLFAGNFLQRNPFTRRTLAYYTDAASKGKREALFLSHEGYFGATGALLHHFRDQCGTATSGGGGGVAGGSDSDSPPRTPRRTKVRSKSM